MKCVVWQDMNAEQKKAALARPRHKDDPTFIASVTDIVRQVKERGDAAVRELSIRFNKLDLPSYKVPAHEMDAALAAMNPALRAAMELAMENVRAFHQAQKPQSVKVETKSGVVCEQVWRAIESVGLYIPSGSAPLYSTLYMQAIPAKIAGCARLFLCTPPQADGKIHPDILAAAKLCGLTDVYAIGGAQAIAAMAYGTATIPKADKICGPGNAYVTFAKQLVASDPDGAAIDQPAGPSEVMVIAEDTANPAWVAADLLAQAEHDADAQAILVTTSSEFVARVESALDEQLKTLPRAAIARQSLREGRIVVVPDMKTAIEVANLYAPEHLILHNEDAARWLPDIHHAGSVFLGPWTPESAGDYASGTNNVLPTYGYARTYGGITVYTFMRTMTVQAMTRGGLQIIGPSIIALADGEGLAGHAAAVRVRLETKE